MNVHGNGVVSLFIGGGFGFVIETRVSCTYVWNNGLRCGILRQTGRLCVYLATDGMEKGGIGDDSGLSVWHNVLQVEERGMGKSHMKQTDLL
jgi:hypothetical protein